ncbi:receptor-type protein kinase, putative [Bodo saltans]|uniref:Receptor-type protein kinase, putative n=1 Tax=Bodo saltans TaxID=75058 RepID=A0A0S4J8S5_BODSA|nr:receptor-type protein kinase, putative [Bodo saltans]|eukprot:CUG83413.1 receptor-type protein kinase, putative [Bodo saltans]
MRAVSKSLSRRPSPATPRMVFRLQSISLSNGKFITAEGLAAICASLVKLEALDLLICESISERGLMGVAALSCLNSLKLHYCTQLTDAALECIVSALTQLKTLHLIGCNFKCCAMLSTAADT